MPKANKGNQTAPVAGKQNKLTIWLSEHKAILQVVLFTLFSLVAFVAQILIQYLVDLGMKNVDKTVEIWPFPSQTLGAFMSFLLSNIAAKVISFVMNRKKTFGATNNVVYSAVVYTIMVVALIIVETIIGSPLAQALYNLFKGKVSIELCNTLSLITYSICDFVIVFLMDKYVIMRKKKEPAKEAAAEAPAGENNEEDDCDCGCDCYR